MNSGWWCDSHGIAECSTSASSTSMVDGDAMATTLQNICELYNDGRWRRDNHNVVERPWALQQWQRAMRWPRCCKVCASSTMMADNDVTTTALWGDKVCTQARWQHRRLGRTWWPSCSNPERTILLFRLQAWRLLLCDSLEQNRAKASSHDAPLISCGSETRISVKILLQRSYAI